MKMMKCLFCDNPNIDFTCEKCQSNFCINHSATTEQWICKKHDIVYSKAKAAETPRPIPKDLNVLIIMVDEMRPDYLGCYGNSVVKTPNLDKLAEEGVIFQNAYSNNPVCLPSRVSLFTGLYPHQHRALTNRGPYWDKMEGTLFELFKKKGYKIYIIT